jgi:hypothetical protein
LESAACTYLISNEQTFCPEIFREVMMPDFHKASGHPSFILHLVGSLLSLNT